MSLTRVKREESKPIQIYNFLQTNLIDETLLNSDPCIYMVLSNSKEIHMLKHFTEKLGMANHSVSGTCS